MKRSIDEDIIQSRISEWEADHSNEAGMDTDLLWARLNRKIDADRIKKVPLAFYYAAAALLLIAIIFSFHAYEKNIPVAAVPVTKAPMPSSSITATNKVAVDLPVPQKALTVQKKIKQKRLAVSRHSNTHNDKIVAVKSKYRQAAYAVCAIQNYSPKGMYATPAIAADNSNTTTQKGLLCN